MAFEHNFLLVPFALKIGHVDGPFAIDPFVLGFHQTNVCPLVLGTSYE
jgi:hypothetical protein